MCRARMPPKTKASAAPVNEGLSLLLWFFAPHSLLVHTDDFIFKNKKDAKKMFTLLATSNKAAVTKEEFIVGLSRMLGELVFSSLTGHHNVVSLCACTPGLLL